jgi:N-acetylneuraminate lyase
MQRLKLCGLTAAPHTPFHPDGGLNLAAVEPQARHLLANGVATAFIGGSTGESASLTREERLALAGRWFEVAAGTPLKIVVHVGSNCLPDARALAAQAARFEATAIAALAPSYFKPGSVDALVECCADIAAAAPETPFYYYDIPELTGVSLPMPAFIAAAGARIPTFNGIKYTSADLMSFQLCLHAEGGRFDLLWGKDECMLAALALGARGFVGSTYNFAAPIYHRLMAAFVAGDLEQARQEQFRSVRLVELLAGAGYFGAAKALMRRLGIPVGPARKPHGNPSPAKEQALSESLEKMGLFDWLREFQGAEAMTVSAPAGPRLDLPVVPEQPLPR